MLLKHLILLHPIGSMLSFLALIFFLFLVIFSIKIQKKSISPLNQLDDFELTIIERQNKINNKIKNAELDIDYNSLNLINESDKAHLKDFYEFDKFFKFS